MSLLGGLFGIGGSGSGGLNGGDVDTTTNTTTNNQTDNTVQADNSNVNKLDNGALMANEVGKYAQGNLSGDTLNLSGANGVVNQFSDNAAQVVEKAIAALQNVGMAASGVVSSGMGSIFPSSGVTPGNQKAAIATKWAPYAIGGGIILLGIVFLKGRKK